MEVASRGEVRSIVLALKFLEVDIIEQITDIKPIILLDDVFSELDDERQKRLFTLKNQVIITSTKLPSDIKTNIKTINLDKN
jgi:DNA replication and repair protein RecF